MKKKILTWICRWSFKQVAKPLSKAPMGIPFIRDPENPCENFMPMKRANNAWADCETDGHYLCKECALRKVETEQEA